MTIKFPRGIRIDIDHVPEDFDSLIRKSFAEYTEGTNTDYTYQDKLAFIDLIRKYAHEAENAEQSVMELMKDRFEYEVSECREFPDKDDFLTVEFMSECFDAGRTDLHSNYTDDHHKDEKIMKLLVRAIKVVMDYEKD